MSISRIVFGLGRGATVPSALVAPRVLSGRTGWGAAVDIGTTTLAAAAFDLATGRQIGRAEVLNPQVVYGKDVLSRVSRALEGDAEALRESVARQIEHLISMTGEPAGGPPVEVVLVGNPAMIHLFLGRDVASLAAVPYTGTLIQPLELTAQEAGLGGLGDAVVRTGPGVSAFVGSDAVAGVVVSGLDTFEGCGILVDLGTNGEIVLVNPDGMTAASAAAGPALEGATIACGMRAEPGAIDSAHYEFGVLTLSTVANAPARGICGSGLIDLGAALLAAGTIDPTGRFDMEGDLNEYVRMHDRGLYLELTENVYISQLDVRELQLAKGAIATAIDMVLEEADVGAEEVERAVVGGAFGSRVDPASLVAIGMIPGAWVDRVSFGGNTALAGAAAMLLDPGRREAAARLARDVKTVPLAARADFQNRFIGALDLPTLGPGR